ncbi:hypothetical protein PENTCL1PPCAC_1894, partial [Pristionchus entomophagus]
MLFLLLLLSLVGTSVAVCPAGYQQMNGGDCFKLYSTQLSFDNAEAKCVEDGGHLASVHSANEQTALTAIMGQTTPLIGMKCTDAVTAHCTWSDGTNVDYSMFPAPGTPNPVFGQCVHLDSADTFWYPWNCASPIGSFLCRIPFNAPVTTCTGDYVAYNGGCAALKKTIRTQSDAEAVCALDGGHLASIHTEADNSFYSTLASNQGLTNNIYIGLAWNTAGNKYKWSDDSDVTFTKWANQFPNTVFGECVQMMLSTEFGTLGQWTNIPCSTQMAYVCWKPSGTTPIKADPVCPGIQFFYDKGTIYSPNFPVSIPSGQTCEYVMATAVGTKVSVSFPVFVSDANTKLSLYNGLDDVTPKTTLSGTVNPELSFESTTNVMKMVFTASAVTTGQGWQADFIATGVPGTDPVTDVPPFDPTKQCPQQDYYADINFGTYVYSPNWPSPYPPLSDCLYHIHSKDGHKLNIQFGYVDTEQCCDVIVVYDGPDNKSPILGRVSGQNDATVKQFYSTGTTITLEFFSDSNNEGNGWIATVFDI